MSSTDKDSMTSAKDIVAQDRKVGDEDQELSGINSDPESEEQRPAEEQAPIEACPLSPDVLVAENIEVLPDSDVESGQSSLESPDHSTKLVEATAVEVQGDSMIPSAVEYDPEAKPPLYKRKHILPWALALVTVVVIVAVILAVTFDGSKSSMKERPGAEEIRVEIEAKIDTLAWDDDGRLHSRALTWIIDEDPMELSVEDPNLVQRYLLAVFYFQTHENGNKWLSCNAPEGAETSYCNFMVLQGIDPVRYRPRAWNRWLSEVHECSWAGVGCDELKLVVSVTLSAQEITGRLPVALAWISSLQAIEFYWNHLSGTIPDAFAALPNLRSLGLCSNQLSGTLPQSWANATSLEVIETCRNPMISGTLPEDIGELTRLERLMVYNTNMRGQIRSHLSKLSSLEYLMLGYTQLSGTIPTEIGRMPLRKIGMERTLIGGTIPSEIGLLTRMVDLRLHSSEIQGSIPEELWNAEALQRLDLQGTHLSGTLSSKVGKLTDLYSLRVSDSSLGGQVPTELSGLTKLSYLRLEEAGFTGQVPPGLCDLRADDGLKELIADCLDPYDGGKPMIACACCTQCCNSTTGYCE